MVKIFRRSSANDMEETVNNFIQNKLVKNITFNSFETGEKAFRKVEYVTCVEYEEGD